MAKIKGEVDVTPQDEQALTQTFLVEVNARRAAEGLSTFPTMDAYADWLLAMALSSYIDGVKKGKEKHIAERFSSATPSVQAQVEALLG